MKKSIKIASYIALPIVSHLFAALFVMLFLLSYEGGTAPVQSSLAPPPIVFIIVWSILLALLSAAWTLTLFATNGEKNALFALNAALIALYGYLSFGRGDLVGALILTVVLLILSFFLLKQNYAVDRLAGYFTLPYVLWLAYALAIQYDTLLLN